MPNEIIKSPGVNPLALEDREKVERARDLATIAVRSGFFGALRSPEAATIVILTGDELGLSPMQSLRGIHIVEGRPVLSADLLVALCKKSTECLFFRLKESSAERATYETERAGEGATSLSWTLEDAKRAQLLGRKNWQTHPAAMLRARCAAALARAVYPDLLLGLYEQDEARDIQETARAPQRAPAQEPQPPAEEAEFVENAPAPDSAPNPKRDTLQELTRSFREAESEAALDNLKLAAKEARARGEITREQLEALGRESLLRRESLRQPTEEPPSREPGADDDEPFPEEAEPRGGEAPLQADQGVRPQGDPPTDPSGDDRGWGWENRPMGEGSDPVRPGGSVAAGDGAPSEGQPAPQSSLPIPAAPAKPTPQERPEGMRTRGPGGASTSRRSPQSPPAKAMKEVDHKGEFEAWAKATALALPTPKDVKDLEALTALLLDATSTNDLTAVRTTPPAQALARFEAVEQLFRLRCEFFEAQAQKGGAR